MTDEKLDAFAKTVCQKMDGLEALREAGYLFPLQYLSRLELLAQGVDEEFGGKIILPTGSFSANEKRARLYIRLHKEIVSMELVVLDMFAKSQGINFAACETYAQLMATAMLQSQDPAQPKRSRVEEITQRLALMTKAKFHGDGSRPKMTKRHTGPTVFPTAPR